METHPRRWWIAGLLTLLGGGVGYLYVGYPRRFLLCVAAIAILTVPFYHGLGGALDSPAVFAVAYAVAVSIPVGFAINAAFIAVRQSAYSLKWYNRWYYYAGVIFGLMAVTLLVQSLSAAKFLPQFAVRAFSASSTSMWPTIRNEYFFGNARHYETNDPKHGEVVVFAFAYPGQPDYNYVKRIVAVGGDTIGMDAGVIILNGSAIETTPAEPIYDVEADIYRQMVREDLPNDVSFYVVKGKPDSLGGNFADVLVPEGHVFVMGDYRDNSNDSRFQIGFVPVDDLRARVSFVYWPEDWSRLGMNVNVPK